MPREQSSRIERFCEYCKKPFLTWRCNIKMGKGRFCSRRCGGLARHAKTKVIRTCKTCGKQFRTSPSRKTHQFCSVPCHHANHPTRPLLERFWEKINKTDSC